MREGGHLGVCSDLGSLSEAAAARAREACRMQINSAVCVLTESTMLEMHLEAILLAHSRFSRSWQLEHVKDEIQLPGLIS